jgi:hypothetical protein
MTFLSCKNVDENKMVVIGRAENEKAGATVMSDSDKKRYYVDGIHSWDEGTVGKMVKVTGELVVMENYPKHQEEEVQEMIGIKRIIKKPKWELAK